MELARVAAITDGGVRLHRVAWQINALLARLDTRYAPGVLHFSAFHFRQRALELGIQQFSGAVAAPPCESVDHWLTMSATFVSLLCLGLFLMDARSQRTFPYVSFMGQTLANHSYANFSLVGTNDTDSVQCHTDLTTCCNMQEESHRGEWYFPNGTGVQFSGDVYMANESQRADMFRSETATSPSGIYRCDIPTLALHNNVDFSVRDRVYVGLYAGNGGLEYLICIYILSNTQIFIY